jgi:hypothetical protein
LYKFFILYFYKASQGLSNQGKDSNNLASSGLEQYFFNFSISIQAAFNLANQSLFHTFHHISSIELLSSLKNFKASNVAGSFELTLGAVCHQEFISSTFEPLIFILSQTHNPSISALLFHI